MSISMNDLFVLVSNLLDQTGQGVDVTHWGEHDQICEMFVAMEDDAKTIAFFENITGKHMHYKYDRTHDTCVYTVINDTLYVTSLVDNVQAWTDAFPDSVEGAPT